MRAKLLATTAPTPSAFKAIAACSRDEPMPKLSPATTTSPVATSLAKRGSALSRQCSAIASTPPFM